MADIHGIGVDVVSIARVARVFERHPSRFLQKLLHPGEYADYHVQRYPARFLARRFVAKEAVVKALGLGFARGAYARRVRIGHDPGGKPEVILPRGLLSPHKQYKTLLSISDEKDYAIAEAILLVYEQ